MKALLVGFGGIGANVYYPELKKLGYEVDVLDTTVPDVKYRNIDEVRVSYDLAVICTPNHTHEPIARKLAIHRTKRIFVEKPGVASLWAWQDLIYDFENTKFHLVKNNLYRDNYGDIIELLKERTVIGVDITWLNKNRIPNPGSWFTDSRFSFSGVSSDLMPHLYTFGAKMFGAKKMADAGWRQSSYRRWSLDTIGSTDYGSVNKAGRYNVDDYASAITNIDNISVRLVASWKEGYDKQSITLFFDDGTTYEWEFGLCPAEAYGTMIKEEKDHLILDTDIHTFLENF